MNRRILAVIATLALLASGAFWAHRGTRAQSRAVGIYDSTKYIFGPGGPAGTVSVFSGNAATGSQTITVCPAFIALPDGRTVNPFSAANGVFAPILIDTGGNAETVTPTATSVVAQPSGAGSACESITASFSNTHGNGTPVATGDQGIQEAINDASNNGGGQVFWQIDPGPVTLATGSANTTLGSVNIPTRSTVMGAVGRVTVTIATCAGGWSLGYSSGTEFGAANTTLTAGTTTDSSTLVPAVAFNAAATPPIVHCTTSNASAGAIHARVWGYKMAAPGF